MKKPAKKIPQQPKAPDTPMTTAAKRVMTDRLKAQQDLELRRGRYQDAPVNSAGKVQPGMGNYPFTPMP